MKYNKLNIIFAEIEKINNNILFSKRGLKFFFYELSTVDGGLKMHFK